MENKLTSPIKRKIGRLSNRYKSFKLPNKGWGMVNFSQKLGDLWRGLLKVVVRVLLLFHT